MRRTASMVLVLAGLATGGCVSAQTDAKPSPSPISATRTTSPSSTPSSPTSSPTPTRTPSRTPTPTPSPTPSPATGTPTAPPTGSALRILAVLATKGRAPMTGYAREEFGDPWLDLDQNGCDTRDDVLRRDLSEPSYEPSDPACTVEAGTLTDPYTATTIHFVRGDGDLVDIDHVVALGNAWVTGADRWDADRRIALANDPMNLQAVDASANRQKGDGDAATWLPHNKGYRCRYVARQISVKAHYGLWVTPPERDAMNRVLTACPDEPQVAATTAVTPAATPAATTAAATAAATSAPPTGPRAETYYANCDAARADGAAPLHTGDPGYGRHLDRDGDGSACE